MQTNTDWNSNPRLTSSLRLRFHRHKISVIQLDGTAKTKGAALTQHGSPRTCGVGGTEAKVSTGGSNGKPEPGWHRPALCTLDFTRLFPSSSPHPTSESNYFPRRTEQVGEA